MKTLNKIPICLLPLLLICMLSLNGFAQTYNPPIGIPAPEFGIEETVESIYGAGYYTHYIDNTDSNATDVDNPFGTAEKPRVTIPTRMVGLAAGSVIEIHGGPYSFSTSARWTPSGTSEQPVFIRGADPDNRPMIKNSELQIGGSYFILENLDVYNNSRISIGYSSPNHVAVRNCEIYNDENKIISYGSAVHAKGEDIVVYNNHIHHHWKGNDADCHGVMPGAGAKRVWILDNHIHHCSGDAFQATHGASSNPPQFVYIGRNIMHEDRENGVDLKYVRDIVISENILYGYKDASTSDGSAMVLGSDGMPNRVWVLFNEIYESRNGIRNEETDQAWIIGNKIHDIEGFAIGLEKKSDDLYIIGNTIYNVNVSIDQFWQENFRLHIFNNIFAKVRKNTVHLNIESQSVADVSEMSNNLFWNGGSPFIIRWASGNKKSYNSTSDFDGFVGGVNNIVGDPLFVNAAEHNFALQKESAAIDAGVLHQAYDTFFNIHAVNIQLDCVGTIRPQGDNWDIGAYEFVESTSVQNEQINTPKTFLLQNYPNPFNPATTIQFEIPNASLVKLEIVNIAGQKIATLVDSYCTAGTYTVDWTGKDQHHRHVGSGIYFYRLTTENRVLVETMLLLR